METVIAVRDPFRGHDENRVRGNIRIDRKYRLVADPEGIRPSGHYGTDGLTERRLGPPSGFGPTADEIVWLLNFHANESELDPKKLERLFEDMREGDKVPADTDIDALEPDHDTLALADAEPTSASPVAGMVHQGPFPRPGPLTHHPTRPHHPPIGILLVQRTVVLTRQASRVEVVEQRRHAGAGLGGHFEHVHPRTHGFDVAVDRRQVELDHRREIHLGDHRDVSGVEDGRILERLVFSFGDRKQDQP